MDANAEKGAHTLQCHTVSYKPRIYQGVCLDCDWTGRNPSSGAGACAEMGEHSVATLRQRLSLGGRNGVR
jgi:hypothetical protein